MSQDEGGIADHIERHIEEYKIEGKKSKAYIDEDISERDKLLTLKCYENNDKYIKFNRLLKYRDSRRRVHKTAGGGKEWCLIRRLKCSNDRCRRLHNELPDCMCPYKHYDAGLIEDVVAI